MPRTPNTSIQTYTVLHALLQTHPTWKYGYDLSKATSLKSGTLYPILRRLHEQGLLSASWEENPIAGRPPRHIYQLTPQGLQVANSRPDQTNSIITALPRLSNTFTRLFTTLKGALL
jgi:PadR family transcriptional regulator, regulatory protein PadR